MWRTITFNSPNAKVKRLHLRQKSTECENLLWSQIKNNKLSLKFKRQYSIGPYIVDFFCSKQKLAIELDGFQHSKIENIKYDKYRTDYLKSLGITVLRFNNAEILGNLEKVLFTIKGFAPSTEAGEGVGG